MQQEKTLNTVPEKTLHTLFKLAMNWEVHACDLYLKFSNLFIHEQAVSSFWRQLSKDECIHLDVLRDILNTSSSEILHREVNVDQWNAVIRVEELIKETTTRTVHTLNDAYELAHSLETSEINTLFKMVINDCLPEDEGHKFIADMTGHIEKLLKFGGEYTLPQRRKINARSIE